jgi:uncharacterized protein YbjQ (UPF0145 family)
VSDDRPTTSIDLKAEVRRAFAPNAGATNDAGATTSDLSMDEELNLHSIGWEPVELVSGVSLFSIPYGSWNWGQGEIATAAVAHERAFRGAISRLHHEAARAGGHGVVGVHIERVVHSTHVEVALVGTAVRPVGAKTISFDAVFVSDLSARDFTLLIIAGWEPLGLATGASFVFAPRRSMGTVLQQQTQNVELTNFTEAMYSARESAMERMQRAALDLHGSGVVEVKVVEGPTRFAMHAVGFVAWGTVVRLAKSEHRMIEPMMVVPLNDATVAFDAATLA